MITLYFDWITFSLVFQYFVPLGFHLISLAILFNALAVLAGVSCFRNVQLLPLQFFSFSKTSCIEAFCGAVKDEARFVVSKGSKQNNFVKNLFSIIFMLGKLYLSASHNTLLIR